MVGCSSDFWDSRNNPERRVDSEVQEKHNNTKRIDPLILDRYININRDLFKGWMAMWQMGVCLVVQDGLTRSVRLQVRFIGMSFNGLPSAIRSRGFYRLQRGPH